MTKRQTKTSHERSAIVSELSRLSRAGWSRATRDDYGPLEDRLREIDMQKAQRKAHSIVQAMK